MLNKVKNKKVQNWFNRLYFDSKEIIWENKNILNLTINSFLVFSAGYLFVNYASIYFIENLGGSKQQLGLILSIYNFVLMFISIPAGLLIEIIGKRDSLVISTIIHGITTIGRAMSSRWYQYGLLTIGQSISPAITNITPDLIIAEQIPEEKLGKAINLYLTITTIPMFIFPVVGGLIGSILGLRMQFVIGGVVFFIAIPFASKIIKTKRINNIDKKGILSSIRDGFFVYKILKGRQRHNFFVLFGMNIMRWFAISIAYVYFTLFLREVAGFTLFQIGIYMTSLQVLSFIIRVPLGELVDRGNKKLFLILDASTDILFALACILFPDPVVIFPMALLSKIFDIPGSTVNDILFATFFEPEKRTKIYAFRSFSYNIGGAIAPILSAFLLNIYGGYNILFIIYIIGSLAFLGFIPFLKYKPQTSTNSFVSKEG